MQKYSKGPTEKGKLGFPPLGQPKENFKSRILIVRIWSIFLGLADLLGGCSNRNRKSMLPHQMFVLLTSNLDIQ